MPLQAEDVPEEELPHPFGHQAQPSIPSYAARGFTCSMPINSTADTLTAVASHIPSSFKRRFSQKILVPENENTSLVCLNKVTPIDDSPLPSVPYSTRSTSNPTMCKRPLFASPIPKSSSSNHGASEDNRLINAEKLSPQKLNHFDGTPAKFVSTPVRLMTATPEIQAPKRHCSTTYHTPVKEPEKQSARAKLLFATPQKSTEIKDTENIAMSISDDDDVINILPETLLQEVYL